VTSQDIGIDEEKKNGPITLPHCNSCWKEKERKHRREGRDRNTYNLCFEERRGGKEPRLFNINNFLIKRKLHSERRRKGR